MSVRQDTAAIPESAELADPANTLEHRFKAWRNLVDNLETYFKQLEKTHEGTAKDYHKLSKTIDLPFKDRGVFEQSGIQDIFGGLQSNAAKLSSDYTAHAKSTDNTLVKSAKNLSSEIKDFIKRLDKDGVKGGKTVSKNQHDTQKHIELLGSHLSKGKTSSTSKATEDPYVTHRGVLSRLDGQVQEENAHHSTLIALQNECAQFEAKIVKSIQDMVAQMGSQAGTHATSTSNAYGQLTNSSNSVSPHSEWNGFVKRDRSLADPNAPPRTAKTIAFAGSDHELTRPVKEGDLLRKGTVIKKYNSAYYVLTPAGFLHEFKSKSFESDPEPAWSLDIKTCAIGAHSGPQSGKTKWTISGKTKGLISSKHDFQFQATSYDDMLEWWTAIRKFAASAPSTEEVAADESDSEATSPVVGTGAATGAGHFGSVDERANAEPGYGTGQHATVGAVPADTGYATHAQHTTSAVPQASQEPYVNTASGVHDSNLVGESAALPGTHAATGTAPTTAAGEYGSTLPGHTSQAAGYPHGNVGSGI